MKMQEKFYGLFGGIGALLAVASVVGGLLQRRAPGSATIANLTARVRAWWVMVAVLAACFLLGRNAKEVFESKIALKRRSCCLRLLRCSRCASSSR